MIFDNYSVCTAVSSFKFSSPRMIRNAASCASGMSITSSNRNLSSNVNFLSVFKISSFIVSLLALCCKWIYKNDGLDIWNSVGSSLQICEYHTIKENWNQEHKKRSSHPCSSVNFFFNKNLYFTSFGDSPFFSNTRTFSRVVCAIALSASWVKNPW